MNYEDRLSRADFLKNLPSVLFRNLKSFSEAETFPTASSMPSVVRVDVTRCLAWGQMECQFCYLACPERDKAIEMHEHKPVIISAECNGCAMCVEACRTINNTPALELVSVSR